MCVNCWVVLCAVESTDRDCELKRRWAAHAVCVRVYAYVLSEYCESENRIFMVKDMCVYFVNLDRLCDVPLHEQSTADTHMKLEL